MKDSKWVKLVEREADFWKNYMMISSVGNIKRVFGCTIRERLTTRKGMIFTHWLSPKAVWQTSLQIEAKIKKNPKFIKKFREDFEQSQKYLLLTSQKLQKIKLSKLSNRELFKAYDKFCRAYKRLYAPFHLVLYIDSIEDKVKRWLKTNLKKVRKEKDFDDYFIKLSSAPRLSLMREEELALLKIVYQAKNKDLTKGKLSRLLRDHTSKYAGLHVVNDETRPWKYEYFSRRFKQLLSKPVSYILEKCQELENYPLEIEEEWEKFYRQLKAPSLIQKFCQMIQEAVWVRLASRNTFASSHHFSKNLFREIGKRFKVSGKEVKWLIPSEVKNMLFSKKKPNLVELLERKQISALLFRDGKYQILQGNAAEELIRKELGEGLYLKETNIFRGVVACPGRVEGKIKVIFSERDIGKMKIGDILVARMTTPDIILAVRKASAIITDEGGITCHAAVVSRELKIPCIIGTKIATKILKDNDRALVDAIHGIIVKR